MNEDRLLSTFLDLVRIGCPSLHEAPVAAYCRRELEAAGCTVVEDDTREQTGSDTGNLIATLPGTLPGKVFFDAHMDSVEPCTGVNPQIRDGVIWSDGTTVLGGDDKVGVASIIELMRSLAECDEPHPTVVGILTVGEEIGLLGSRAVSADLFEGGEPCFVLDDSEHPGTVTLAAPTHYVFTATFTGKAAHAGVCPEAGISAIQMAADAIAHMPLGRLDQRTCANVGTISGGTADNVVAAQAVITGECRSLEPLSVMGVKDRIQQACDQAAAARGGSVEVAWTKEYDGYDIPEDHPAVQVLRDAAASCGFAFNTLISLGGSDANVLGSKGCVPLVLGTGMTDFHTTTEHLAVGDLIGTCQLALAIVRRMGDRG
ncbi:MAG: M20/M25/M40 family metallo-hydrolase [Coriobacteriales bacterium]|nr:M20/M25/M40 family metallo-hydrolase [Coriobacteriales bacterium]